jgi:hypothetical protein
MTGAIALAIVVWGSLMGMLIMLIQKGSKNNDDTDELGEHSLTDLTKSVFLKGSGYAAHHSKRGFLHFLRITIIHAIQISRITKITAKKYYKKLVHYIDGKDILKKRHAASLYLKNIAVHKDDARLIETQARQTHSEADQAKKESPGHIVE